MLPITLYVTPSNPKSQVTAIRSLAFSSNGEQIAVGYENGLIEIYPVLFVMSIFMARWLREAFVFRLKEHENLRMQPMHTVHDRSDRIQAMAFSPRDKYLAVGCIDGAMDIYDAKTKFQNLHLKTNSRARTASHLFHSSHCDL